MPIYVYRREDGTTFELKQKITDDKLKQCLKTGQKVERLVLPFSVIYKGNGFYSTDNKRS
jgi:predicted nucleic acid-binding Zn ribbon protein